MVVGNWYATGGGGEIADEDGSVEDLGEWGVIAALKARMPAGPLTSVGIGDDSAVVTAPSGSVVAAVDLVIEGRHFRREWSSAYDVGVKAAARSLADIAAMGAVNTALLVALATPATLQARWATDLAEGLAAEATRAGAGIVGGDTARADTITVSVTALGDLEGRRPVLRSGARPGDIIAVAGTLGHAAAGLALLTAGLTALPTPLPDTLSSLVATQLRPAPPYDAGPEAARLAATAMIDVSDGLLADLSHVATASAVRINIETAALPLPAPLREAASFLSQPHTPVTNPPDATARATAATADAPPEGRAVALTNPLDPTVGAAPEASAPALTNLPDPAADAAPEASGVALALDWVLTGGEDHSLVAAFPPETPLPPRWRVIGQVLAGTGVTVDGTPHTGPSGWQHFA